MKSSSLIKEIRKGLVVWYDFQPGSNVLYLGETNDALADFFISKSGIVYGDEERITITVMPVNEVLSGEYVSSNRHIYDYIVGIESLEIVENPQNALNSFKDLLKADGICLLGLNNRLGIRYFCGDRDKYTGRNFDGVDNYRYIYSNGKSKFKGRMFSKAEIETFVAEAGFFKSQFYSVFSDLQNPSNLFRYGYMPREDVTNRIFPTYNHPGTVFLDEEYIYPALIENGMFHQMANGYLVELAVSADTGMSNVLQVTTSMDRRPEDAMVTIVYADEHVEKRNVYAEGATKLDKMIENAKNLQEAGVSMVPLKRIPKGLTMPYIDAPTGQLYLRTLLLKDREAFLTTLDQFYDQIMKSSIIEEEDRKDGMGVMMRYGYPDLVPLNSFYKDGQFLFFDQEFREDHYPANVAAMRVISMLYYGNPEFEKIIPAKDLYERYNLNARMKTWKELEWAFLRGLRNEEELKEYRDSIRRNQQVVNDNRFRINYREEEYRRYFVDALKNIDSKKLILFGSGRYAKAFFDEYHNLYEICKVVDNNEDKWGQELFGKQIESPEVIKEFRAGEYKVLICIKDYMPVMDQLLNMGVREFSIFDPNREYERVLHPIPKEQDSTKRYHVGYISGTFDLFHIGHLNILKRAKELCDYLIVGVVTDEGTMKHKGGVVPFVPFEERAEILKSCRYVDEVVKIPIDYNGPKEAFEMYHFDVQFNGTDHMNEPYWIDAKKYLQEHGSDMVFFPYTLNTNSTNLKALINKKLID